MSTALTAYLTSTNDTIPGADRQLTNSAPASETNVTVKIGKSTGWDTLPGQGATSNWAAGGSEPSPLGTGFIWDVTTLEGNDLLAGNYTPTIKCKVSVGSITANVHCRIHKWNSVGGFTLIAEANTGTITINTTATAHTMGAVSGAQTSFTTGDKLYIDFPVNIVTNSTGSNTATWLQYENGGANERIVTPGYQPSTITTTQTQTGRARITVHTLQTQAGQSRVQITTTRTQTGKANIAAGNVTTTQTQVGTARIQVTNTKTQLGKAAIRVTTIKTQLGKARMQITSSRTQTGKGRVTATTTKTQTGKSRVQITSSKTQTGKSRVTVTTLRTITGVANIAGGGPTTRTISGIARITVITPRVQTGKASIRVTTTRTQAGKSRVQTITTKTSLGRARIQDTSVKIQTGKSNIKATTVRTIAGKANISGGVIANVRKSNSGSLDYTTSRWAADSPPLASRQWNDWPLADDPRPSNDAPLDHTKPKPTDDS